MSAAWERGLRITATATDQASPALDAIIRKLNALAQAARVASAELAKVGSAPVPAAPATKAAAAVQAATASVAREEVLMRMATRPVRAPRAGKAEATYPWVVEGATTVTGPKPPRAPKASTPKTASMKITPPPLGMMLDPTAALFVGGRFLYEGLRAVVPPFTRWTASTLKSAFSSAYRSLSNVLPPTYAPSRYAIRHAERIARDEMHARLRQMRAVHAAQLTELDMQRRAALAGVSDTARAELHAARAAREQVVAQQRSAIAAARESHAHRVLGIKESFADRRAALDERAAQFRRPADDPRIPQLIERRRDAALAARKAILGITGEVSSRIRSVANAHNEVIRQHAEARRAQQAAATAARERLQNAVALRNADISQLREEAALRRREVGLSFTKQAAAARLELHALRHYGTPEAGLRRSFLQQQLIRLPVERARAMKALADKLSGDIRGVHQIYAPDVREARGALRGAQGAAGKHLQQMQDVLSGRNEAVAQIRAEGAAGKNTIRMSTATTLRDIDRQISALRQERSAEAAAELKALRLERRMLRKEQAALLRSESLAARGNEAAIRGKYAPVIAQASSAVGDVYSRARERRRAVESSFAAQRHSLRAEQRAAIAAERPDVAGVLSRATAGMPVSRLGVLLQAYGNIPAQAMFDLYNSLFMAEAARRLFSVPLSGLSDQYAMEREARYVSIVARGDVKLESDVLRIAYEGRSAYGPKESMETMRALAQAGASSTGQLRAGMDVVEAYRTATQRQLSPAHAVEALFGIARSLGVDPRHAAALGAVAEQLSAFKQQDLLSLSAGMGAAGLRAGADPELMLALAMVLRQASVTPGQTRSFVRNTMLRTIQSVGSNVAAGLKKDTGISSMSGLLRALSIDEEGRVGPYEVIRRIATLPDNPSLRKQIFEHQMRSDPKFKRMTAVQQQETVTAIAQTVRARMVGKDVDQVLGTLLTGGHWARLEHYYEKLREAPVKYMEQVLAMWDTTASMKERADAAAERFWYKVNRPIVGRTITGVYSTFVGGLDTLTNVPGVSTAAGLGLGALGVGAAGLGFAASGVAAIGLLSSAHQFSAWMGNMVPIFSALSKGAMDAAQAHKAMAAATMMSAQRVSTAFRAAVFGVGALTSAIIGVAIGSTAYQAMKEGSEVEKRIDAAQRKANITGVAQPVFNRGEVISGNSSWTEWIVTNLGLPGFAGETAPWSHLLAEGAAEFTDEADLRLRRMSMGRMSGYDIEVALGRLAKMDRGIRDKALRELYSVFLSNDIPTLLKPHQYQRMPVYSDLDPLERSALATYHALTRQWKYREFSALWDPASPVSLPANTLRIKDPTKLTVKPSDESLELHNLKKGLEATGDPLKGFLDSEEKEELRRRAGRGPTSQPGLRGRIIINGPVQFNVQAENMQTADDAVIHLLEAVTNHVLGNQSRIVRQ